MPPLLELCKKYFLTTDLYKVLGISEKATDKEVKKAYHALSLKVHPDRVKEEDKLEATEKFKVLGNVHAIISDGNKRAAYDETGTVDEDSENLDRDWSDYWRLLFKTITDEDIVNYEKEYVDSAEELQDLKKAYLAGKGDMDYIVDHVQFARSDQEIRLRERLNELIAKDEIPSYKIFTHEPEKKRKRRHAKEKKEAVEAEKLSKDFKKENDDLALMIRNNQKTRDSFLDDLAAKYGGESSKSKSKKRKAPPKTETSSKKLRTRK